MSAQPAVTVVIPAYNAARTIAPCLAACLAQDYPDVEVIVVDDGSTDGTARIVRAYPVRYIRQDNAGPATARNRGWRAASGDVICFTDADCVPQPGWVAGLVRHYTADDVAGVGGSYGIVNDDNLLAACVHEEIVQRHLRMPDTVDYLGSFNASYRRRVLEEVGGFDESYRMASGEDNDLAYRVRKRGYRLLFDRDVRVAHQHPERLWPYLRSQFWHGYWRMKLYRDHPRMGGGDVYAGLWDFVQPPLAVLTLGLLPLTVVFHRLAYVILGLVGAALWLQLPIPLAIVRRTGQPKYLFLAAVTLLRGYARGLGMALGVFDFFVRQKGG